MAALIETLEQDEAGPTRELIRSLVDQITLHPEGNGQRVELRGELAVILGLAGAARDNASGRSAEALSEQVKLVAGTRCHFGRTRMLWGPRAPRSEG